MKNLTIPNHPCAGKCQRFTDEQCNTCLVQQVEKREFDLGLAPDDAYVKTESEFLVGDVVVYTGLQMTTELRTVVGVFSDRIIICDSEGRYADGAGIRVATPAELKAKRRLTASELSIAEVS